MLQERAQLSADKFFPLSSEEKRFFVTQTLQTMYRLRHYSVSVESEYETCKSLDRLQFFLHCLTHGLDFTLYETVAINHPDYIQNYIKKDCDIILPAWTIHISTGMPERSNSDELDHVDERAIVWRKKVVNGVLAG